MLYQKILACSLLLFALSGPTHSADDNKQMDSTSLSFFMNTSKDLLSMAHGKSVPLASFPEGIPTLAGTPIANMLALTSTISDASGKVVGIASELEEFPLHPSEGSPIIWDTLWTVMLQGRGSLYLYQQEVMIQEDVEIFTGAITSGQTWEGSKTHPTTYGPLPSGHGIIKGGTGEFDGITGTFQEIVTLQKFTPEGHLGAMIELRLNLDTNTEE